MSDKQYMSRCLQLAAMAGGKASPNPMVGSVVVLRGNIIGEGYHQRCGEAHAEVNAINAVADKSDLPDATLYVNLEPCTHHGRTPPCADLIIKHQLKRVVIGCVDTFSKVAGRGIARLREAGIEVTVGCMEAESLFLNRRFFTFHTMERPYIILKWAQTQDGFVDILHEGDVRMRGVWITNQASKQLVHKWRSEESAIMAGTGTLLADNPQLTVREWAGSNPVRIVPDRRQRLPDNLAVFDGSVPTIRYSLEAAHGTEHYESVQLPGTDFIREILTDMHSRQLTSLFVEGGPQLLNYMIEQGLWDEARVFVGDKWFGNGLPAPCFPYKSTYKAKINEVELLTFFNDNQSN